MICIMRRKKIRRMLINTFKTAGADKIIGAYIVTFFVFALAIWIWEPGIGSYIDSLWFCFASATSIGYGDIVAVTFLGRVLTVILSVYSIAVIAIITAVITGFLWIWLVLERTAVCRSFLWTWSICPKCQRRSLNSSRSE